jgi:hypothetical protein
MAKITVATRITADEQHRTVFQGLVELEVAGEIRGRHGWQGDRQYMEVDSADASAMSPGSVAAVRVGGSPSVAAAYSRDGHMEGGLAGVEIWSVDGVGREHSGRRRLYGSPLCVVPLSRTDRLADGSAVLTRSAG